MEIEMKALKRNIGKADAAAYVDDELVCKGELMFALTEK